MDRGGSDLAYSMSFIARIGNPCGIPFVAEEFLENNPDFEWVRPYLLDMPTQPGSTFKAKGFREGNAK